MNHEHLGAPAPVQPLVRLHPLPTSALARTRSLACAASATVSHLPPAPRPDACPVPRLRAHTKRCSCQRPPRQPHHGPCPQPFRETVIPHRHYAPRPSHRQASPRRAGLPDPPPPLAAPCSLAQDRHACPAARACACVREDLRLDGKCSAAWYRPLVKRALAGSRACAAERPGSPGRRDGAGCWVKPRLRRLRCNR